MSKSKRLVGLMMAVNRKRRFKVRELAEEFGVSARTIMRDLQELSELGVPLYAEPGPHGGYQVVRERVLPPIAFAEQEAVAMFFAVHALRHYVSLPFETESSAALNKFYLHMPGDIRDRIDAMKNRVDFVTPPWKREAPFLATLLDAAIGGRTVTIEYESRRGRSCRRIRPVGLYANSGLWYCPAYCFSREDYRVFRCDRITAATADAENVPLGAKEKADVHLGNWREKIHGGPGEAEEGQTLAVYAELTREGVQRCQREMWLAASLHVRPDGTGYLEGGWPRRDVSFYARFFVGLGAEAAVERPAELIEAIRSDLAILIERYCSPDTEG